MDDTFRPLSGTILICLFAALIGVGAFVSIPLPFTPVPVGLQTLFVILAGLVLGPIRGAAAVLVYLMLGLLGLPVFAAGTGGPAHFVGPTGGYLVGFLPAAFLTGLIAGGAGARPDLAGPPRAEGGQAGDASGGSRPRGGARRVPADVAAVIAGTLVVYALGVPWLKVVTDLPWPAALSAGLVPFLPGDGLKAVAAVALAPAFRLAISRSLTRFA